MDIEKFDLEFSLGTSMMAAGVLLKRRPDKGYQLMFNVTENGSLGYLLEINEPVLVYKE
jgi:hypothetical protein